EFRYGTECLQAWQATEHLFDGKGNLLFDLFRTQRRGGRIDLYLHWGRVRKSIDIEIANRHDSADRARHRHQNHQKAMPQGGIDDPVQHGSSPRASCLFTRRWLEPSCYLWQPQPSPRLAFSSSATSTALPLVATISPGSVPANSSVKRSSLAP